MIPLKKAQLQLKNAAREQGFFQWYLTAVDCVFTFQECSSTIADCVISFSGLVILLLAGYLTSDKGLDLKCMVDVCLICSKGSRSILHAQVQLQVCRN